MALRFDLDPDLTDELRGQIVALWVEVTNAGGAVGFVAPVTAEEVAPVAYDAFAGVTHGPDRLLVGYDVWGLAGLLFFTDNRYRLKSHWCVLKRVMVRPGQQGGGYGTALLREAARLAPALGWQALQITVRPRGAAAGRPEFQFHPNPKSPPIRVDVASKG